MASRYVGTSYIVHALSDSYVNRAACDAEATAEVDASRKKAKYAAIVDRYVFEPIIAIDTLGVSNMSTRCLGTRLSTVCLKKTSPTFLAITRESIVGFL